MSDAETDDQNDSDEGVYHRSNVDITLLILSKVFLSTMTWTLTSRSRETHTETFSAKR